MAKLTSPYGTIYRYDWKGNYIDEWASTGEIKRKLGFENELIGWTPRGKNGRKTAYGYQWKTFKVGELPPASTTTAGRVILRINSPISLVPKRLNFIGLARISNRSLTKENLLIPLTNCVRWATPISLLKK